MCYLLTYTKHATNSRHINVNVSQIGTDIVKTVARC